MVMSGGQRLVGPGGQVIVAAPGQQLVRTSGGEVTVLSADHNLIHHITQVRSWSSLNSLKLNRQWHSQGQVSYMTLLLAMYICPDQKNCIRNTLTIIAKLVKAL